VSALPEVGPWVNVFDCPPFNVVVNVVEFFSNGIDDTTSSLTLAEMAFGVLKLKL
jgi:hypothetical protein